jgi:hypothetical protein
MQKPPPDRFLFAVKDLSLLCVDYLQVVASGMFELSDQKARDFLVSIALPLCFFECVRQLFSEIPVRI